MLSVFRAGAAEVDITPPLGIELAGYRRPRKAEGVHDPLMAKALVLDDGFIQLAIVACDLLCIDEEQVKAVRKLIEDRCDIPAQHAMITATHTHTGPVTTQVHRQRFRGSTAPSPKLQDQPPGWVVFGEIDQGYLDVLTNKITDSVQIAQSKLQEARLRVGVGVQYDLSFNRRAHRRGRSLPPQTNELLTLLKEGIISSEPSLSPSAWAEAAKCIDPEVGVLTVEDSQGQPLAVLVNFALHLDTVGGSLISADYPGYLSQMLRKLKGKDLVVLFCNGACGDINHIDRTKNLKQQKGFATAKRIGTALAGEVLKILENSEFTSLNRLNVVSERLIIELRRPSLEELEAAEQVLQKSANGLDRKQIYAREIIHLSRAARSIEVEIQVLSLGNIAFVALPGEIFVELGLEIKRKSPFPYTFVIELANGYVGYVPTREAFEEGGYEVMLALTSKLAPMAGEMMVSSVVKLLHSLHAMQ